MTLTAEYRIEILDTFKNLQCCLTHFHEALQNDEGYTAWMQPPPKLLRASKLPPRELAYDVISQLEYLEDQAPREILVCAGFIGASEHTLEKAHQLNLAKENFKATIVNLKNKKVSLKDTLLNSDFDKAIKSRVSETASTLKKMGLARLHLKQCYRKIPILSEAPLKISWTWAHTRSIKRVSVNQAQSMLLKKSQDVGIQNQLSLLAQIPPDEPLAIVQELAPHLRANILLPEQSGQKNRVMVKGPIPILFPANLQTPAPLFKPPGEKLLKDENRLVRKDVRIDPKPFLPAIRAHRYLHVMDLVNPL